LEININLCVTNSFKFLNYDEYLKLKYSLYIYMPNRWIEFVKKWASEHNTSYGCALTKPEMKEAYHKENPKKVKMPKRVAKLQESKPPADVKSKMTFPNLKIVTQPVEQEQENIQFEIEEMDKKAKRGRPQKYATKEEQYKAKLESNKQKRREKAAAKKAGNQII